MMNFLSTFSTASGQACFDVVDAVKGYSTKHALPESLGNVVLQLSKPCTSCMNPPCGLLPCSQTMLSFSVLKEYHSSCVGRVQW